MHLGTRSPRKRSRAAFVRCEVLTHGSPRGELDETLACSLSVGDEFQLLKPDAYLDNIPLPPEYRGLIKVYFQRSEQTVSGKYDFAVQHFLMDSGTPALLGGVDYEIVKK
jgi:hypothetical protein